MRQSISHPLPVRLCRIVGSIIRSFPASSLQIATFVHAAFTTFLNRDWGRSALPGFIVLGSLLFPLPPAAAAIRAVRIADGLAEPLFITVAPGDSSRLYIVEKPGRIRVFRNGAVTATLLDIREQVESGGSEQGLLGLAFHPDFAQNRYFFVYYTREPDGATVISRWSASTNDQADPGSESIVLIQPQPFSNHNGGMLVFGPDGYLYTGLGDGGSGGDPSNNAQNLDTLLGKILRLDVNNGLPYSIPPGNPFAGATEGLDEVWAYGLRNPWRFSFDRQTGDLYIADVGQNMWEEIHVAPATSEGGENYGWRLMEGNHCFNPRENCERDDLERAIHEYSHEFGCSITGGYVYRGCAIPELAGHYIFGDYCSNRIWSFRHQSGGVVDLRERTQELRAAAGPVIQNLSSFGEDWHGELYATDLNDGEVFKIVPDSVDDQNGNGIPDGCESASAPDRRLGSVDGYRLYPNRPNPFNPQTEISYDLPGTSRVRLTVHDITGRLVTTLVHDTIAAGHHTIRFDGYSLPSGVYIYRLQAGNFDVQNKMILLK